MTRSGTVVRFLLAPDTKIPQEGSFTASLSNFYMLRLIAADPAMSVNIRRFRSEGLREEELIYDFDLGTVLYRDGDVFNHARVGEVPVEILVARSDRKMIYDPYRYERRENGLLFVDDNDAVLDLTLLPEYNADPLLSRIYGIVKLTGIRKALEVLLEERRPEAILTETRDGFDGKSEIVRSLFDLVRRHVRPVYEAEQKRERKGTGERSQELDKRFKDALRALNRFHLEETGGATGGPTPPTEPKGPLSFGQESLTLIAGHQRNVTLYVEREQIHKELNVVELSSDNPKIRVVPESEVVTPRKGSRFQTIGLNVSCAVTGETGNITAFAIGVDEKALKANLKVKNVTEPPLFVVPPDIEFRPARCSGKPHAENQLVLLVNLDAFPGFPSVKFRIVDQEGAVTIGLTRSDRVEIKADRGSLIQGHNVAKITVLYWGTAWGARAKVEAKAKRKDGVIAIATCRVDFREPSGQDQFKEFFYEPLGRSILGEAAGEFIYVNSDPPFHQKVFGTTQASFEKALEDDSVAQMRVAAIVTDAVVFAVASKKYAIGGEKGLHLGDDPVTGVREFIEGKRYELDAMLVRAFVKRVVGEAGNPERDEAESVARATG